MADLISRIFRTLFPPEFTVSIRHGVARRTQGKAPSRVVSEFSEVARQLGIAEGAIYGVRRGDDVILEFERSIPESSHQRFRNVWGASKI